MDGEPFKDPSYTGRLEFLQDKFRHPAIKRGLTKRGQNKLAEAVMRMHMVPDVQYLAEKAKEERDWPRDSGVDALRRAAQAKVGKPTFLFLGPLPLEAEGSFLNLSPRQWEPVLRVLHPKPSSNVKVFGGEAVSNESPSAIVSSAGSSSRSRSIPCGQPQPLLCSTPSEPSVGSGITESYQDMVPTTSTPPATRTMILPISSTKKVPPKAACQPMAPCSNTKFIPCGQPQRRRMETAPLERDLILSSSPEYTDTELSSNNGQSGQQIGIAIAGVTDHLTELSVGLSLLTEDGSRGLTGSRKSQLKRRKSSESPEMVGALKRLRRMKSMDAGVQMPSQSCVISVQQHDKGQQMPSQPSQSGN